MDDLVALCLEHIALEGSKGCSEQSLWQIIAAFYPHPLDDCLKSLAMLYICSSPEITTSSCLIEQVEYKFLYASASLMKRVIYREDSHIFEHSVMCEKTLQIVAAARNVGVSQASLCKLLDLDARSVFYVVKRLLNAQLVVKYPVTVNKAATNLIFLWKFAVNESDLDLTISTIASDANLGLGYSRSFQVFTERILDALKMAPGNTCTFQELYEKCQVSKERVKNFRRIMASNEERGLLERFIAVDDRIGQVYCCRLKNLPVKTAAIAAEPPKAPILYRHISMEDNLYELLQNAGNNGLIISDISAFCGYSSKKMSNYCTKMVEKYPAVFSKHHETVGKERRSRFTLALEHVPSKDSVVNVTRIQRCDRLFKYIQDHQIVCVDKKMLEFCNNGSFTMDRKTIQRDLSLLATQGLIKAVSVSISLLNGTTRLKSYYMLPHISSEDEQFQSLLKEAKIRDSNLLMERKISMKSENVQFSGDFKKNSNRKKKPETKYEKIVKMMTFWRLIAADYGLVGPKMHRIRLFHLLLFKFSMLQSSLSVNFLKYFILHCTLNDFLSIIGLSEHSTLVDDYLSHERDQKMLLTLDQLPDGVTRVLFYSKIHKFKEKVSSFLFTLQQLNLVKCDSSSFEVIELAGQGDVFDPSNGSRMKSIKFNSLSDVECYWKELELLSLHLCAVKKRKKARSQPTSIFPAELKVTLENSRNWLNWILPPRRLREEFLLLLQQENEKNTEITRNLCVELFKNVANKHSFDLKGIKYFVCKIDQVFFGRKVVKPQPLLKNTTISNLRMRRKKVEVSKSLKKIARKRSRKGKYHENSVKWTEEEDYVLKVAFSICLDREERLQYCEKMKYSQMAKAFSAEKKPGECRIRFLKLQKDPSFKTDIEAIRIQWNIAKRAMDMEGIDYDLVNSAKLFEFPIVKVLSLFQEFHDRNAMFDDAQQISISNFYENYSITKVHARMKRKREWHELCLPLELADSLIKSIICTDRDCSAVKAFMLLRSFPEDILRKSFDSLTERSIVHAIHRQRKVITGSNLHFCEKFLSFLALHSSNFFFDQLAQAKQSGFHKDISQLSSGDIHYVLSVFPFIKWDSDERVEVKPQKRFKYDEIIKSKGLDAQKHVDSSEIVDYIAKYGNCYVADVCEKFSVSIGYLKKLENDQLISLIGSDLCTLFDSSFYYFNNGESVPIRIWNSYNGSYNDNIFKTLLCAILSIIFDSPGIQKETLQSKAFEVGINRVELEDILQSLISSGDIISVCHSEVSFSLFGSDKKQNYIFYFFNK